MNNKDFINALAAQTDLSSKVVQKLSTAFTGQIADRLDDNTQFAIQGFGTFEVKKKLERIIVNPTTKQRKLVPPKLVLAFKPSPVLKDKMQ